ncbi:MAG: hypothetical protein RLZZ299_1957 [Pseudomonadota bacterium]|jgi:LysR family hydrogen peroxide-inducible transcriptional activator
MTTAPHPFTLRQLQYALAIHDRGSFRAAAEACHVAQPSLSAQVAQLEDALGVVLFERDRRGVLPTPAGSVLLERMRRLVVDADALREAARRAGDPLDGTLRLGVIPTIAPYLLPTLAPRLREAFPRLSALWTEERTPVLAARLASGALDAALLAQEADLGDVTCATVGRDPFVLAAPRAHRLAAETGPVEEDALRDEAVLLLEEGHCLRTQALAWCARTAVHELAWRATSLGTLAQVVASGAGITLLPRLAVDTEVRRADLVVRPLAAPAPFRTLVLAWRTHSPLAPALERLAGVMREAYGSPSST